jgi:DNA-binding helix-hairpin-helix protein with protein kinase domain
VATTQLGRPTEPELYVVSTGAGCRVREPLGSGGQGDVFAVEVAGINQRLALKWYHPAAATSEQRRALRDLIEAGAPHSRFLWPLDIVEDRAGRSFGYLMNLRPPDFVGVVDLISGRVPWSARTVATVGLQLADSFWLLHSKGLCYRDINFGNVFLRPVDGAVLVCDNDNVGIDGQPAGQVLGTPFFMAPEVMVGAALPSSRTDRYSLAVLLFYLLMRHHPLLGARELAFEALDHAALSELLGAHPVFIFDPGDDSNRPEPSAHRPPLVLWPMYPSFIRHRFVEAFTRGLKDPEARVGETMWKREMARLRDAVFHCEHCSAENYAAGSEDPQPCWNCHNAVKPRAVLALPSPLVPGGVEVCLESGVALYPHHLSGRVYDFQEPSARVSPHAAEASILGLQNLGAEPWSAQRRNGARHTIEPGKTVRIEDGLSIDFGSVVGVIHS